MRFLQVFGLSVVLIVIIGVASLAAPPPPHRMSSTYFRIGGLRADEDADADLDVWYSRELSQMRDEHGRPTQPPIWQQGGQQVEESYREIVSHDREYIMALRVYRTPEGKFYQFDETDFRANGGGRRSHKGMLREDQWRALTMAAERTHLLGAPPQAPRGVTDCPDYVVEGRKGDKEYGLVSLGCRDAAHARRYEPVLDVFDQLANQLGWFPY